MSTVSEIFTNFLIPAAMSRPVVVGAGVLSVLPALEMAVRTIQDIGGILSHTDPLTPEKENEKTIRLARKEKLTKEMIIHGLGVLVLGGCALNLFTGSGILGLAGYLIYARYAWKRELDRENQCRTTIFSGIALQLLSHFGKQIIQSLAEKGKQICLALIHSIKVIAKAGVKLLKIFRPFIRHPRLGLGILIGLICLIGYVKYGHRLTGPSAATSYLLHQTARGIFYAGSLLFQGLCKSAKPI